VCESELVLFLFSVN